MSETTESCTKAIYETCKLHPVDCDNCQTGAVCGQRKTMQAYPNIIKSCPHFRPKRRSQL